MGSPKASDEHVLVISAEVLWSAGRFQGLLFDVAAHMELISDPSNVSFRRRSEVETDPNFNQIIPYVILIHNGSVFSYLRGQLLSEKRLIGSRSIGVGGHISAQDVNLFARPYEEGMRRELDEEVAIESVYKQRVAALLNDDSNHVGRVHFGIVHVLEMELQAVWPRERSMNQPAFRTIKELKRNIEEYESWSRVCIEDIERLICPDIKNEQQTHQLGQ